MEIEGIPDCHDIVHCLFEGFIAAHPFNADQIRFLRAVQNVSLHGQHLELAAL